MLNAGHIGVQGGEAQGRLAVLDFSAIDSERFPALDRPVEWMRFCSQCQDWHLFVADRFCVTGLIGRCLKCRDERIAPFTRTNSEAA